MKTITLNKSFDDLSPIANTKRNKTLLSARNEHSKNLLIGDDDISLMKLKILIQSNIQKEYEKWTYLLLSIVGDRTSNENVHVDLGTPIQKRLQKIEDLQNKKTQADYIKSQHVIAEEKRRAIELEKKNRIKQELERKILQMVVFAIWVLLTFSFLK